MKKELKLTIVISATLAVSLIVTTFFLIGRSRQEPNGFFLRGEDGVLIPATIDEDNPFVMKVGKYIHTSGDETNYIEIFDDSTLQIFGYSNFQAIFEFNGERYLRYVEEGKMTQEEYDAMIEEWKAESEQFNQRRSFWVNQHFESLIFGEQTTQGSGPGMSTEDRGNTIVINDDNKYVYAG
ncbi:MAG: hypothetical protein FWG83_00880 [Oscillospiraceae bacterium]|nr:hypothetical protein [Oscillospiraceae bacterium]